MLAGNVNGTRFGVVRRFLLLQFGSMNWNQPSAELYIPEGGPEAAVLPQTTHLAIGAHADDAEFMAFHGIGECFEEPEKTFGAVICTDGRGSARTGPFAGLPDDELVEQRREEQRAAARIGQYGWVAQLAYPSATVKDAGAATPLVDELCSLLQLSQPKTVYLHNPFDRHPTHIAVFWRSIQALRQLEPERRPTAVYGCEVWRDLDWLEPDDRVALPVGRLPELQKKLNGVFQSQIAGGKRYDLGVLGRRRAHATFNDSHAVDDAEGLTFAVDLSPLLREPLVDPVPWLADFLRRFSERTQASIQALR